MMLVAQSLLGVVAIPLLAWFVSVGPGRMPPLVALRWTMLSLALVYGLALALTQLPWTRAVFDVLGDGVFALQRAVDKGAQLMFGHLAGGAAPYDVRHPEHGYLLAFRMLPMILVLSAIVRLLYHWGVLQRVVALFALLLQRSLGVGGALATVSASSVFLGIVEAPLLIRPYLSTMGRGALFATMTCTMATVAGTVMALYATILAPVLPGAAGHLLAGSVINVPAALLIARLMHCDGFGDDKTVNLDPEAHRAASSIDAIVQGTMEGIRLAVPVAALLIVTIALLALCNAILLTAGQPFGIVLTIDGIMGVLFAPAAWLLGIPTHEAAAAGALLGKKLVFNEFLAYLDLARLPPADLSERTRLILTYAMCGFANLGSLGIAIGGFTALAPERRADITALAPWCVLAGMLATWLSGAVIGTLTWS